MVSLGCRLNAAEAEEMRELARAAGLTRTTIVNTCAVTGEAVRQAGQQIRRLRREAPAARIVVTGCAAQIEPARFAAMAEVDHVVGNAEKMQTPTWHALAQGTDGAFPRVLVGDIMAARTAGETTALPRPMPAAMPRGFVQVQNGCDHRCTFCVIPFGRGRSRSVPADMVVGRVRGLVETGMPEVVLAGVDITSWGADLPGRPTLGHLVRRVLADAPRLQRLRLSSIDQAEVDPVLLDTIAQEARLMPHLHLSLQSGNDLILKRMRRRHSRAQAIAFCDTLRRLRPDIAVSADLIAGFPTESEAQFGDTLALVDECGLAFLHVFPYSARTGTAAARMPQVAGSLVRERAARLRAKGEAALAGWLGALAGRRVSASLERAGADVGLDLDADLDAGLDANLDVGVAMVPARTPQFARVLVSGVAGTAAAGETVVARVRGHDGRQLLAEAVT